MAYGCNIKMVIALLILCIGLTVAEIHELSSQTFKAFTENNNYFFLYFSAPKCSKCIPLEIQYSRLDKLLANDRVKLAKIDGVNNQKVSQSYSVNEYPTILFFHNGYAIKYFGLYTSPSLNQWVQQYFEQRIKTIDSLELIQAHIPYVVLETQQSEKLDALDKVLFQIEGVQGYHLEISNSEQTKISLHTRNGKYRYQEIFDRKKLKQWIEENTKTSVNRLNSQQNNQQILFNEVKPALVVILKELNHAFHPKIEIFTQLCDQFSKEINCGLILESYQSFQGAHGYFKVKDTNKTVIGLVKEKMNIAYRLDIDFNLVTQSELKSFLTEALNDRIQRVVDNVAPKSVNFKNVVSLTQETLKSALNQNKFVFINFYHSADNVSLFFSRPYDALAGIVKGQEQLRQVIVAAFDCSSDEKQCKDRNFRYYPTLQLFINGVLIQYERTPKLPEIPDLTRFLHNKVSRKIELVNNQDQISNLEKPFILLVVDSISKRAMALPALHQNLKFYHLKSQQKELNVQLHSYQGVINYQGELKPSKIIQWIKQQSQFMLSDVLRQVPDDKITQTVQRRDPIIVILDSNMEKRKKYRYQFGLISRELQFCGAFANSEHPGYKPFLQWLQLEESTQSRIVYIDIKSDKKYLYEKNLDTLTTEQMESFFQQLKEGNVKPISERRLEKKSEHVQQL